MMTFFHLMIALSAYAQMDVWQMLEQLEENQKNAKINLEQYEDNLDIVETNLRELESAEKVTTKRIGVIEKRIEQTEQYLKDNQASQDQLIVEVTKNQKANEVDTKTLERLKKDIALLEKNIHQRQELMKNYEQQEKRLKEQNTIAQAGKNQMVERLDELQKMNKKILAENRSWSDKKTGYEGEIRRWSKESTRADELNRHYQKLVKESR